MKHLICLVGEAWGAQEERAKRPFVGAAGQELTRMLQDAGIARDSCYITNVFNFRPENNDIKTLCCPKKELPSDYKLPALSQGQYVNPQYLGELDRLSDEIKSVRPNIIITLGNTATWAVLRSSGIASLRGTIANSRLVDGFKVLPTYHPAAVLRQWQLRHVTVLDLIKGRVESTFPEIRRPRRRVHIVEKFSELAEVEEKLSKASIISFDIETKGDHITCIGFSPDPSEAFVIPFYDRRKAGCYWDTTKEEMEAWRAIRGILSNPAVKVAQNGMYDVTYLWMIYRIPVNNFTEDTMLLHHSLQPESPKGLDFLGSVYCNDVAWKTMRPRGEHMVKRDD